MPELSYIPRAVEIEFPAVLNQMAHRGGGMAFEALPGKAKMDLLRALAHEVAKTKRRYGLRALCSLVR